MLNKVIYEDNRFILPSIESNSVDLILTDPPYIISKESNFTKVKDEYKHIYKDLNIDFGQWDENIIDYLFYFEQFHRVLKKGGRLIMFYDIWKMGDIKEIATNYKFTQPRIGTWVKTNPVPVNSKNNYLSNSAEYFISLTKSGWVGRSRAKSVFNSEYDNAIYNYPTVNNKYNHPTQKPTELLIDIINTNSNMNDIILDPFMGSGSTALACEKTNRNFIGIENYKEYIDICKERGLDIG